MTPGNVAAGVYARTGAYWASILRAGYDLRHIREALDLGRIVAEVIRAAVQLRSVRPPQSTPPSLFGGGAAAA